MTLPVDSLLAQVAGLPSGSCSCTTCMPVASRLSADGLLAEIPGLPGFHLYDHTIDALLNDGDEILDYYIDKSFGWDYVIDTEIYSVGHSIADIVFIQDIFNRLDPLIDLDFRSRDTNYGTEIDFYSVNYVSSWGDAPIVGQARARGGRLAGGGGAWWDVLWRDTDGLVSLNDFDRNTIVHEIGHALGLSHPNNDPFNGNWNTDDTVMSYNISPDGWDYWFSEVDIAALQAIWGVENDMLA